MKYLPFFWIFIVASLNGAVAAELVKNSDIKANGSKFNQSISTERSTTTTNNDPLAGRKYRYPSMMVKEDMYHSIKINGEEVDPLLLSLFMKRWEIVSDKYSRNYRYLSPVMTFHELQDTLNFHDEDLKPIDRSKPEGPHAHVVTDWLVCEVTYIDKPYDGKNKSIRVKAVVIDVELQANADAHAEYDKNKGFIRTILDMFSDKAHVK